MFGLRFTDEASVTPIADAVMADLAGRGDPDPASPPGLRGVVTPNVDIVVQLDAHPTPAVAAVYRDARFVLPDGQPLVLLSRLLDTPLRARLTGSDLFAELWARVVAAQLPVLVVAASEELRGRFVAEHPGATVVVAPQLDPTGGAELARFVRDLLGPHLGEVPLVLLGLGHPRDALMMSEIVVASGGPSEAPFVCCLGGSAEMYFGLRRRAPEWVQRSSLEWLFRLVQEPRRLAHRYLVRDRRFFALAFGELRAARRRRRLGVT